MMDYAIFKEIVAEKFKEYLSEEYQDMELRVHQVEKVNCTLDGLNLVGGQKEITAFPTIYINDMYERYKLCNDLQDTLQSAAAAMEKALKEAPPALPSASFEPEKVKNHIIFQLVNTQQNSEMLKKVPHREYLDLSIIYRWLVKADEKGIQSAILTDALTKTLGFSEEQLYHFAEENTKKILPPMVEPVKDIIRKMFLDDGMPEAFIDELVSEEQPELSMWIISNDIRLSGAASILYEDTLSSLAEQLDTDLYILPSSIHEFIAVSAHMDNPNELAEFVAEVNMNQLSIGERLSNQVYHYDKTLRKLSLATNTPNKRLDDIIADTSFFPEKQSRK